MSLRVSAVMSVHNGEAYLAAALDSMLAELGADDELIVVDDGSTDGTAGILASYAARIIVLSQPNSGAAAALNRAVAAARGAVIAFNDADDLWEPGCIATALAALERDAGLDLVFGMSLQFASPELPEDVRARLAAPVEILAGEIVSAMVARGAALQRLGGFDETRRQTYGYSWLARAKAEGLKTHMLDTVVSRRRLHASNWSRMHRGELNADALQALRQQILRRRNPAA